MTMMIKIKEMEKMKNKPYFTISLLHYFIIAMCTLVVAIAWQSCGSSHDLRFENLQDLSSNEASDQKLWPVQSLATNDQQTANILLQIFTPHQNYNLTTAENNDLIWLKNTLARSYNQNLVGSFGGNCDLYTMWRVPGHPKNIDSDPTNDAFIRDCNVASGEFIASPLTGQLGAYREAMKIALCENILARDNIIRWMVMKAKLNDQLNDQPNEREGLRSPADSDANLSKVDLIDQFYNLFYPAEPIAKSLHDTLLQASNSVLSKTDDPLLTSRLVLLSLCESTNWELIE